MNLLSGSFLDGTTGWYSNGSLSIDASTRGAPGRLAIVAVGATLILSPLTPVSGAARVFASHWSATGQETLGIAWRTAADVPVGTDPFSTPMRRGGLGRRGLPFEFDWSSASFARPAGATHARLVLRAPAATTLALLKPSVSRDDTDLWRPGAHLNPDLNLPSFPALPFLMEGYSAAPTPSRTAFAADTGVPMPRVTGARGWTTMRGLIQADAFARDMLRRFFEETPEPFWIVQPDTDELRRAWWAEGGEPVDQPGPGDDWTVAVGLLLEPA